MERLLGFFCQKVFLHWAVGVNMKMGNLQDALNRTIKLAMDRARSMLTIFLQADQVDCVQNALRIVMQHLAHDPDQVYS